MRMLPVFLLLAAAPVKADEFAADLKAKVARATVRIFNVNDNSTGSGAERALSEKLKIPLWSRYVQSDSGGRQIE